MAFVVNSVRFPAVQKI